MGLGLRRLVVAGVAVATVAGLGTRTVATAVEGTPSWGVSVGSASRTLLPGTDTTIAYEVRNTGSGSQRLRGTTAEVKNDGVDVYDRNTDRYLPGCLARWFRVTGNDVATGVDVAPDASVPGSLVVVFDDAAESQGACQSVALDVVVSTT